jgi:hypothetical protein
MSFENFIQKFKKEINTNDIFDGSFNISNIKNYISSDPALEEELQYYSNKIESYKSIIYDRLEKSGKQHVAFSTLTSNVDISDNTAYENYENKKENNDTFYDNFQNDKGSGREAFNDDFKTTFESKRNNNSLNFCTNMLGNVGKFNLVIPQTLSSTFFYMNLIPVNKLKTLSGGSSERRTQTGTETEMHNKPKAYYQGTVNNVTVKILLEIITLNQSPYFYTTIFNNNTYYCPIFQVVNGLIVSSELFPEGSYLQFIYSSSNTLTNNNNNNNNNNITSNQSPIWSWVRIYETEKRQSDSDYGNPSSNKKTYLYYVYTNDPSGPQTNYLYPSNVPDYCPDGIILPWTIYLYSNGNVYTLNANQGANNVYETLFSSVQSVNVGGFTVGGIGANKMAEKLGYYPSNI